MMFSWFMDQPITPEPIYRGCLHSSKTHPQLETAFGRSPKLGVVHRPRRIAKRSLGFYVFLKVVEGFGVIVLQGFKYFQEDWARMPVRVCIRGGNIHIPDITKLDVQHSCTY